MKLYTWLAIITIAHYSYSQKNNILFNKTDFNNAVLEYSKGKVPDIDTHSLFKDYNKYIILDCREHTEYSVSHLKNSLWVGYTKFNTTNLPKNSKNKKIVVYCTIGWRSEKIGEKLLNMGYTNIHNLKGSILKWNNDGYPLYKNKQKTEQIHSYNKYFSKYVKTGKIIN